MERIRERLPNLAIFEGDIFELARADKFSKIYLSNAHHFGNYKAMTLFSILEHVSSALPVGGLIYLSDNKLVEQGGLLPDLCADEKLSSIARKYERLNSETRLLDCPTVYRRI